MTSKILNGLQVITSLIVYLEWGQNNHTFLFKIELDILSKLFTQPLTVLHPLIITPLIGQSILIFSIFQKQPNKTLTIIGLIALLILITLILLAGLASKNFLMIISTIPFFATCILTYRHSITK